MQSLFDAMQNVDETWRLLAGGVVIFIALAAIVLLAERLDKRRVDRSGWYSETRKPAPTTSEHLQLGKIGGWVLVAFVVLLAVVIYALAGGAITAMLDATVGEMM